MTPPSETRTSVILRLRPAAARRIVLILPWLLSGTGLLVEALARRTGDPELFGFVRLLSLSHEGNLPTLYQGGVLVVCGVLLGLIGSVQRRRGDRFARHWVWLSAGFVFMGIDEWTSIHELFNQLFDLPGVFYFGWIIPYGALALVLAFVFAPFLRSLPAALAVRFLCAGMVYLAGALGMELPLGWWSERHGVESWGYVVIDWVEESLELFGAGYFAATLVELVRGRVGDLRIQPDDPTGSVGR